ncbi:hypothetical protein Egran_02346 [Elaphomyces granulatus]|uniref:DH domain-containing protein n=1 Tax=Elaphomyces granulatus TaxID=519963 RepID=A0A232M0F8_9EURO|nr:hypothetical protein Egran_02346 [Elaphomyces granulatus]
MEPAAQDIDLLAEDTSERGSSCYHPNHSELQQSDFSFSESSAPTAKKAQSQSHLKKWVDSIRSRKTTSSQTPRVYIEGWVDEPFGNISDSSLSPFPSFQELHEQQWDRLSGGSSSILETVKTTSISINTQSAVRSRATTQSTHQSVCRSNSEARGSIDSVRLTSTTLDDGVRSRAIKRREILHEILTSEVDYVMGLRTLADILSTVLMTRPAIYHDIQKLREIHERFLSQLRVVTPMSQDTSAAELSSLHGLQERWSSIDLNRFKKSRNRSLRTRNLMATIDSRIKKATADPSEAVQVARELSKLSEDFVVYENYCSKYDLLYEDMDILRKTLSASAFFDQGIEALAKSVASTTSRRLEDRKSMTLKDLLIKPVQRVCKYPLLLQDLLKCTPASDCPLAFSEINQVLDEIRLLLVKINTATGNPVHRDRIQKTIVLQERLDYSGQDVLQNVYRQLGPMILCGVLHVAYQSSERVTGEYMVCILFSGYMVLAKGSTDNRKLAVVACLYILDMTIDVLANGKEGLHCYHCPFSWKVIFQDYQESYELILSASSATEEKLWKMELLRASAALPSALPTESLEPRKFFLLALQLSPLDRVHGPSALLTRRSSLRSEAPPMSLKLQLEQVIIKKTHLPFHDEEVRQIHDGEIERSRSLVMASSPTILAPRRQDRVKLERHIADIYTRDVLPYPGMVLAKGDYLYRSPGSLMRKISFRTPFSRRSTTGTTKSASAGSDTKEEDGMPESSKDAEETFVPAEALLQLTEEPADSEPSEPILDGSLETPRLAQTVAFRSVRRRVAVARSDFLSRSMSDRSTAGSEKAASPRKRWNPSMALMNALTPSRNRVPRLSTGE